MPTNIESSCLGMGNVRLARACSLGQLLLREPASSTEHAQGLAEDKAVLGGVGHVGGEDGRLTRTCQV